MSNSLLPPPFLFRFSAPLRKREAIWPLTEPLEPLHRLPAFGSLADATPFASLAGAWNETGLSFSLHVTGGSTSSTPQGKGLEDNDGLQLWIDTRATQNVHRASRFCHRFLFLPSGSTKSGKPMATALLINRARQTPKPPPAGSLQSTSQKHADGYTLFAHIPAAALTGFDPEEHPRLGFFYAVNDQQQGLQTWSIGREFPYAEDPSLWGTLELTD